VWWGAYGVRGLEVEQNVLGLTVACYLGWNASMAKAVFPKPSVVERLKREDQTELETLVVHAVTDDH